jgi:hypothetical protein
VSFVRTKCCQLSVVLVGSRRARKRFLRRVLFLSPRSLFGNLAISSRNDTFRRFLVVLSARRVVVVV